MSKEVIAKSNEVVVKENQPESDNRNGAADDAEKLCDNDKTDATAIEVLSPDAVTHQQQNNKNGRNNNNNNKKNKKNAKGGKLDSPTGDEIADVEA